MAMVAMVVDDPSWARLVVDGAARGTGDGEFDFPAALVVVPGLGLVVREHSGRLQVFATLDSIAVAAMSHVRVAWMGAVARTAARRR